jgi:hypothetical protein
MSTASQPHGTFRRSVLSWAVRHEVAQAFRLPSKLFTHGKLETDSSARTSVNMRIITVVNQSRALPIRITPLSRLWPLLAYPMALEPVSRHLTTQGQLLDLFQGPAEIATELKPRCPTAATVAKARSGTTDDQGAIDGMTHRWRAVAEGQPQTVSRPSSSSAEVEPSISGCSRRQQTSSVISQLAITLPVR